MGQRIKAAAALVVAIFALSVAPARSEDFYQGKTITMIVGASAGGELDIYTRLLVRYLGKYILGNPSVIVQNMPGAGSLVAANYIYNVAQPDGLTVGAFGAAVVLQQAIGDKSAKFDGRKFGWIGAPTAYYTVCAVRQDSGIKTIDDWFATKKALPLGGMGPGASFSDTPRVLGATIGLPMKLIEGYGGGANIRVAMERGEVDGYCASWQGMRNVWRDAFKEGKYLVVLQASIKSHPDLATIPLAIDYAKSDEAKQLIRVNDTVHGIEYVYAMPPAIPQDKLQLLRTAFTRALGSPELLADAEKATLEIQPLDGPTLGEKLGALYDLPAGTVSKLAEIFAPKAR